MAAKSYRESEIHISSVDQRGRIIAPHVLAAAYEIRWRVLRAVEKEFGDPAIAVSILEASAADVSQALRSAGANQEMNGGIRNLQGYLFRSVVRRMDRYKARQLDAVPCTNKILRLEKIDPRLELERRLLIEQLLERCSLFTQKVFHLRTKGYSWDEIGQALQVPPRSASTRYSKALRQLRAELGHSCGDQTWSQALASIRAGNGAHPLNHRWATHSGQERASPSESVAPLVRTVATLARKKPCQSVPFSGEEARSSAAGEVPVPSSGAKGGSGVH